MTRVLILAAFIATACGRGPAPEPPAPERTDDPAARAANDAAAAMLAAGRVASIDVVPSPIVVTRGDTVVVRATLRDAQGDPVTGALWGVQTQPGFEVRSNKAELPDSYLFWGTAPVETELGLFVGRPPQAGNDPDWTEIGRIHVIVKDHPVARVEIEPPAFAAYAGTAVPFSGRAITTAGNPHATARIEWSTSNPAVAEAAPDGTITFRAPGSVEVLAAADGERAAFPLEVRPNPVARVTLSAAPQRARTGDVLGLAASATDAGARAVDDVAIRYRITPLDGQPDDAAEIHDDGAFVAEEPGRYRITASAGGPEAATEVEVSRRDVRQAASFVGQGPVGTATTDLWVFEGPDGRDYAYTGTMGAATMYAWDVTEPARPVMTDSITVDGRRVNDVKVNDDRTLAIVTSENASNRRNGITILDIQEPAHPRIITHYTENLTGGVHNVWFYGDLVYAVHNGTLDVHIIDISDPARPREVGRWGLDKEDKYLHDVSVVDGLAYLSYWDDGLVILDVGAGIKGGSPTRPAFVASINYRYDIGGQKYGNTHHAIRYGKYVFLGDEIFGCPECGNGPRGYVHVVDVSDIENPREVAYFKLPDAGTHNLWVEDDKLYIAYYQGGLRVVDVSGELRGDLLAQGREIAAFETALSGSDRTRPMAWGPQPYKGNIFVSDMNSGLWIVKLEPPNVTP